MKRILTALACTGILSLAAAAAPADAQVRVGVAIGVPAPVVAVPACPGAGYIWTPGYYAGAVFVPGRWVYRGYDRDAYFHADDHARYDRGFHGSYDREVYHGHDGYRGRR